jgi:protein SCO1/2
MNQTAVGGSGAADERGAASQGRQLRRSWLRSPRAWLYAVAVVFALSIVAFNVIRPIVVLPRIAPSPGFALVGSDGQPATSEDQRGFLTLYSFSYLDCDDACPQSYDDIAALRANVADALPAGTPLRFVTISLDPQRDTPQRLSEAAAAWAQPASAPDWQLLTGDPLRTRMTVGGGFRVYFSEPKEATAESPGRVTFDPRYVLVDHLGIMRAEYRTGALDPALLARDVNLLLEEAANSQGVVRLGYEAAHLFLCYPR